VRSSNFLGNPYLGKAESTTDDAGRFLLELAVPQAYDVTVSAPGFAPRAFDGVEAGTDSTFDVPLDPL
jgi:hypothetical protein